MNINTSTVTYSSIVEIGELIANLEKETGDKYLKLHRGVMDVTTIDLNSFAKNIDFNQKKIQQYGGNDGDTNLINTIKDKFHLNNHYVMTVPGGMATLDVVINSLSDKTFWVPKYHWGSWNKILTLHNKEIKTFNDFDIKNAYQSIDEGVVMLCYPSNPTGYAPKFQDLKAFADICKERNQTLILDLPYYYLFNDMSDKIYELYSDNVIIVSSFSKSVGLSGLRIGYIATKNKELYNTMKIRSLYKYNSISTVPQEIINQLLTSDEGQISFDNYRIKTKSEIKKNIQYLSDNGLLFDEYTDIPTGPFAIINKTFDELLSEKISSVPLNKFTFKNKEENLKNVSRISVSVEHNLFVEYFDRLIKNT
jgi:aspartate/methionine/tyrosine aminotransferase